MLEVTIHVTGLEKLADAIMSLSGMKNPAAAPAAGMWSGVPVSPTQTVPVQPGPAQIAPTAPAPVPGTPSTMSGAPMQIPGPIPTTAVPQEYTQDQIAVAMTGLSDQGRSAELVNILARFGVSSLVQVPKERYPELVLVLREAGAAI
ncbi:MAG: hypothetical protein HFI17_08385 [Lachnospiraceae bacterium]|jgi:hypothetical protein|nr:hypothetical protein [Lachnospiraceae bacterium]